MHHAQFTTNNRIRTVYEIASIVHVYALILPKVKYVLNNKLIYFALVYIE